MRFLHGSIAEASIVQSQHSPHVSDNEAENGSAQ
jgi:hypothetical protein